MAGNTYLKHCTHSHAIGCFLSAVNFISREIDPGKLFTDIIRTKTTSLSRAKLMEIWELRETDNLQGLTSVHTLHVKPNWGYSIGMLFFKFLTQSARSFFTESASKRLTFQCFLAPLSTGMLISASISTAKHPSSWSLQIISLIALMFENWGKYLQICQV